MLYVAMLLSTKDYSQKKKMVKEHKRFLFVIDKVSDKQSAPHLI